MILAGRRSSAAAAGNDHESGTAAAARTPSTSSLAAGSVSGKPFNPQGSSSRPPPSGAGPDDEAPQLVEGGATATGACPRFNEMLLVYLALLYGASFTFDRLKSD